MDPDISKTAIEVTGKVAQSIAPAAFKKVLSWVSPGRGRQLKQRGSWERRRDSTDRRISGLDRRLRKGLWLEYHRKTEVGKFDILELEKAQERDTLFSALVNEARRYEFSDRASKAVLPVSTVVDSAVDVVSNRWKRQPKAERQAIVIVEGIAEYLFSKYNVTSIDQRQSQRRATAAG
jgi:hypothetical protein